MDELSSLIVSLSPLAEHQGRAHGQGGGCKRQGGPRKHLIRGSAERFRPAGVSIHHFGEMVEDRSAGFPLNRGALVYETAVGGVVE